MANGGVLRLNASHELADVLVVDRTSLGSGATTIAIDRREDSGITPTNGVLLVEVRDKSQSANGVFKLRSDFARGPERIVIGSQTYGLFHNGIDGDATDGNWYLREAGASPQVPVFEAYAKMFAPANRIDSMAQRLSNRQWMNRSSGNDVGVASGEEVGAPGLAGMFGVPDNMTGIWASMEANRYSTSVFETMDNAQLSVNDVRLQFGADFRLGHDWVAGVSLQYSDISGKLSAPGARGRMDADRFTLGGALTWFGGNGLYVDGQASAYWQTSDMRSLELSGSAVEDVNGYGGGVSAEIGQRRAINDLWNWVPQGQLSYNYGTMDDFTDPYGAKVSYDDTQSLRARAGLALEYRDPRCSAQGTRLSAYGITNLFYEFIEAADMMVDGTNYTPDDGRLWGGLGIGGSYEWQDGLYAISGEVSANTSLEHAGDAYDARAVMSWKMRM